MALILLVVLSFEDEEFGQETIELAHDDLAQGIIEVDGMPVDFACSFGSECRSEDCL